MAGVEAFTEAAVHVDKMRRKFKPRTVSQIATAFALLGLLGLVAYGCLMALQGNVLLKSHSLNVFAPEWLLTVSVFSLAVAVVAEIVSRFRRCPPPCWRIREECKYMLLNAGLLPEDCTAWKRDGLLRFKRPKFNRANGLFTMRFDVRHANATEEKMDEIAQGSSFKHCQDMEIVPYVNSKNNRRDGWELRIWYRPEDDVFARLFRRARK